MINRTFYRLRFCGQLCKTFYNDPGASMSIDFNTLEDVARRIEEGIVQSGDQNNVGRYTVEKVTISETVENIPIRVVEQTSPSTEEVIIRI